MSHSCKLKFVASDEVSVEAASVASEASSSNIPPPVTTGKDFYKCRKIQSKGAILVLVITLCIDIGKFSAINQILLSTLFIHKLFQDSQVLSFLIYMFVGVAIPQLFYPLAGWMADARFGRHRVIQIGLWCVWIGQCLLSVPLVLFELLEYSTDYKYTFIYGLFPVSLVVINVGLAAFEANIIQFGIDQMVDASGDQVSAFIHWYYWSTYIGAALISVLLKCFLPIYTVYVLEVGINVLLTSVALLCWHKLKKWFIIEPQSQNPFKTVYDVVKFASKHSRPIYRSALTYWDDRPPSRLDYGKDKYGGPFSTEEVENVKSFFAITLVLLSLGLYIIADNTLVSPLVRYMQTAPVLQSRKLYGMKDYYQYRYTMGDLVSSISQVLPVVLVIPACELLIYPLMQNYIPSIMRKIGTGMLLAIASNVAVLILYSVINKQEPWSPPVPHYCFLEVNISFHINATLPAPLIAIPIATSTFSEALVYIAAFEFICAQSPYGFRGMLIGTFYAIQGLFTMIAILVATAVTYGYKAESGSFGCGYLYYPVVSLIAVLGFVLYMVIGHRYRRRVRDEDFNHYLIAEEYYLPNEPPHSDGHVRYQTLLSKHN